MARGNRKPRKKGKGHEEPCIVCEETRETAVAHFPKPKSKGGEDTILLCPTHHRLLDNGRLGKLDYEAIWKCTYPQEFDTVEEFVEWAYENRYPYCVSDLQRKFWYDESRRITRRLVIEEAILDSPISALYTVEFGEAPFTVGAPHHAPGGIGQLPCHRVSDENVGFLAIDLAKLLNARCIVAANYWLDANKVDGDYLGYVRQRKGDRLVEIHAHCGEESDYDIEISCGVSELSDESQRLARSVSDVVENRSAPGIEDEMWESIEDITIEGDFSKLKYTATETVSLQLVRDSHGVPYHIEISPRFRKDKDNRVPREGKVLMGIIAEALRQLHPSPE